jgi:NitT/TauT family transport system substrate-binding protein
MPAQMAPRRLSPLLRTLLVCSVVMIAGIASPRPAAAVQGGRPTIPVLVPDAKGLEGFAFWVALGGGYFAREGIDVRVVTPESPPSSSALVKSFRGGAAPVAVLPGPAYERLVADRFPVLLVANILQNDPLELVVRREVADNLKLSSGTPVRQRLGALRGAKIGVSVADRVRLYQLFHAEGLDANLAGIVVRKGDELLAEFSGGKVDALFVPPLYAAKALADRDGVVYVDTAGGEVPAFADRLVQALAVTSEFARAHPGDVQAFVRALAKAEHVLHFEPNVATEAIVRAIPDADRKVVARAVATYLRAIPATPHVEARLIKREAAFYPAGDDTLDLSGIDLESFVLNGVGYESASRNKGLLAASGSSPRRVLALLGAFALALALLVVLADQREARKDGERPGEV